MFRMVRSEAPGGKTGGFRAVCASRFRLIPRRSRRSVHPGLLGVRERSAVVSRSTPGVWEVAGHRGVPSWATAAALAHGLEAGTRAASHRTTLAALGVVHGGEPSRPPRAYGCE